jgi:hypothetical protein
VRLLATELHMTDYVLTGLVKRRAELAGEIEATHVMEQTSHCYVAVARLGDLDTHRGQE